MRSDDEVPRDVPEPREPADGDQPAWSGVRSAPWRRGPQTPADRAAARRRLDHLADES
jgi:hypothetical protein